MFIVRILSVHQYSSHDQLAPNSAFSHVCHFETVHAADGDLLPMWTGDLAVD